MCLVCWRKSGEEEKSTVQERGAWSVSRGLQETRLWGCGQCSRTTVAWSASRAPQGAWSVSRGTTGNFASPQAPPRPQPSMPSGPRRAAGSRQRGLVRLRPSRRLPPSPSPSRQVPGPARPARGSSRRRRGCARDRGNRGCARQAGGHRSARAGSRWGSVRSHPPASLRCSGPAVAASTRRTAAPLWPPPLRAPRTRALLQRRARAAAASGRIPALRRVGGVVWTVPGPGLFGIQDAPRPPAAKDPSLKIKEHPLPCGPGPLPRPEQRLRDVAVPGKGCPGLAPGGQGRGRRNWGWGGVGKGD